MAAAVLSALDEVRFLTPMYGLYERQQDDMNVPRDYVDDEDTPDDY